jgi:ABC-type phosphate/phosphonate transport system substrate-binding protein
MKNSSAASVAAALTLSLLNSGCSNLQNLPEVRVIQAAPTAPRLPVTLRQPVEANFAKKTESSLASYYKSPGTQTKPSTSVTGSSSNTSATVSENERTNK